MVVEASTRESDMMAVATCMEAHESALRRYFARRVESVSEVDDLVQETFARMLAARRDDPVQSPLAYLFRIASNLLADRARGRIREKSVPLCEEEIPPIPPTQEDWRRHQDLCIAYADALDELSSKCRLIFIMRRHDGLSTSQIARIKGISPRMVQKHLAHAMEHLHSRLRHFVIED